MPKVKDLIKNAIFTKSEEFDSYHPDVTVILPTYRRGDDGLFTLCVESILNQTFRNFELIIVDDASYDSTFSQIEEFMKRDYRIACIRHEKNIGLPAISEAEAYLQSRGQKIFYAFDDNEYKPDAIEASYHYQHDNLDALVCYSVAEALVPTGENIYFGRGDFNYNAMISYNYIPNGGMMLDRKVIEDIGLYDPHICITRLCDWDLWLRIGRKYKFHKINKVLSVEKGIVRKDSLGNTHYLDHQVISEWVNKDRNEALKPSNILEYDVAEVPEDLSFLAKVKILTLLKNKFTRFYEQNSGVLNGDENAGYVLIVNEFSASTELYFANISDKIDVRFIIISDVGHYFNFYLDLFLNARAVIFSRCCDDHYVIISDLLKYAEVPYYYYTDDNFFELDLNSCNGKNKKFIKNANGVLVSSDELASYYKQQNLHDNLYLITPVISDAQKLNHKGSLEHFKNVKQLNLVFGSVDRFCAFVKLSEEMKLLAERYRITIYVFGINKEEQGRLEKQYRHDNILLIFYAKEFCHNTFINILKNKNIHFFIHPKNDEYISNYRYKSLNFLINGYLTSSLVLFPDVFPYSKLQEFSYIEKLVVSDDSLWINRIEMFLNDFSLVEKTFTELEKYCLDEFDAKQNVEVVSALMATCKPVDILEFCRRVNKVHEKRQIQGDLVISSLPTIKKAIKYRLKPIYKKLPQFAQKTLKYVYLKIFVKA